MTYRLTLIVSGALVNEDNTKKVSVHMDMDGERLLTIMSSLQMEQHKYTPSLEILIPGRKPVTLSGQVQYEQGKSMGADLTLKNVFKSPVSVKGRLTAKQFLPFYDCVMFAVGRTLRSQTVYIVCLKRRNLADALIMMCLVGESCCRLLS